MSKQAKKNASTANRNLWLGLGILVAILAVAGAVLVMTGGEDTEAVTESDAAAIADLSAEITPQDYQNVFVSGETTHFLLDVRTPDEFNSGHIANANNISVETLASRLSDVPTDEPIVIYCRSGNRSAQAASILKSAGYTQVYDLGGIIDWQAAGFPIE